MKRLLTAILCVMSVAGHARGDAHWYALENSSKVDMATGSTANLTGRIAIAGCGDVKANIKGTKIFISIYSVNFDTLPEILQTHINDSNKHIALFDGTGGVDVSGDFSMIAYRDGKLFSVDWVIQHQLNHDYGTEAVVYNRMLQLDSTQQSIISSQDDQQTCPDSIELHLVAKDIWRTYVPRVTTTAAGAHRTETVTTSYKEEVIGHVTVIARAIPNSTEKIDAGADQHKAIAEVVYAQTAPQSPNYARQTLGHPVPPDNCRMPLTSQSAAIVPKQ